MLTQRRVFPAEGTVPGNARFVLLYEGGGFETTSLQHLQLRQGFDAQQILPINLQLIPTLGSAAAPSTALMVTPASALPPGEVSLWDGSIVPCPAVGQCGATEPQLVGQWQVVADSDAAAPVLTSQVSREPSLPVVCEVDECCATPVVVRNQLAWSAGQDPDGPPPIFTLTRAGSTTSYYTFELGTTVARICSGEGRTPGVDLEPGTWNLEAVDQAGHRSAQATFVLALPCANDAPDAGPQSTADAGPVPPSEDGGGCGCRVGRGSATWWPALLGLALLCRRRRARRGSP